MISIYVLNENIEHLLHKISEKLRKKCYVTRRHMLNVP